MPPNIDGRSIAVAGKPTLVANGYLANYIAGRLAAIAGLAIHKEAYTMLKRNTWLSGLTY
jgi:hypothetical protein